MGFLGTMQIVVHSIEENCNNVSLIGFCFCFLISRFCPRSLLALEPDLIDKIPGRQNDRKTPLGELNWIFTAITDTIAWNVLPRGEEFISFWRVSSDWSTRLKF